MDRFEGPKKLGGGWMLGHRDSLFLLLGALGHRPVGASGVALYFAGAPLDGPGVHLRNLREDEHLPQTEGVLHEVPGGTKLNYEHIPALTSRAKTLGLGHPNCPCRVVFWLDTPPLPARAPASRASCDSCSGGEA